MGWYWLPKGKQICPYKIGSERSFSLVEQEKTRLEEEKDAREGWSFLYDDARRNNWYTSHEKIYRYTIDVRLLYKYMCVSLYREDIRETWPSDASKKANGQGQHQRGHWTGHWSWRLCENAQLLQSIRRGVCASGLGLTDGSHASTAAWRTCVQMSQAYSASRPVF